MKTSAVFPPYAILLPCRRLHITHSYKWNFKFEWLSSSFQQSTKGAWTFTFVQAVDFHCNLLFSKRMTVSLKRDKRGFYIICRSTVKQTHFVWTKKRPHCNKNVISLFSSSFTDLLDLQKQVAWELFLLKAVLQPCNEMDDGKSFMWGAHTQMSTWITRSKLYSQQNTALPTSSDIPPGASSGVSAGPDCPTPLDPRPSTGPPPGHTKQSIKSIKRNDSQAT